jgi:hypothetical protein
MDILLLGFEFANLYILEASFKGVVYSIKLKLEFAVLGKLVQLVKRERTASTAKSEGGMMGGRAYSLAFEPGAAAADGIVNGSGNGGVSGIVKKRFPQLGGKREAGLPLQTPSVPPGRRAQSGGGSGRNENGIEKDMGVQSDGMKLAERTRTAKSSKSGEDALFEHYERAFDVGDDV